MTDGGPGAPTAVRSIVRLAAVDSTQTVAFALAEGGALDGTVIVADTQRLGDRKSVV